MVSRPQRDSPAELVCPARPRRLEAPPLGAVMAGIVERAETRPTESQTPTGGRLAGRRASGVGHGRGR
ncbi:hypothetical protein B1T47_14160 [Mycobacterium kansasii]|nr:hypothetical protein B1T47_14160 [Mycobacterium kansasii]